jgi:signal transduction histidine kinase
MSTNTATTPKPPEKQASPGSPLRPRARLLRTLGEELISSEVVAVIELVKNAYDADATRVLIRFTSPLELGQGQIEVIDDGHGMTLSTVQNVWLEPATPSKRGESRRTPHFARRYLGEKGIGRFASARLAKELEVSTRTKGSSKEVYALFDWAQFDNDNRYLDEILILTEEREPVDICVSGKTPLLWRSDSDKQIRHDPNKGTVLRMSGLKQKWEAKHFEDLRRGLSRLIPPRLGNGKQPAHQDFEIELDLPPEFSEFSSKVHPPEVLKYPHYTVSGHVKTDGKFKLTYKILAKGTEELFAGQFLRLPNSKGKLEFRAVETKMLEDLPEERTEIICGPLELQLRVWDRDELGNVVQTTHSTIRNVRRDLDAVAGVNIYRDNFRVLPYGEPQDDWLRLDIRRVQKPTVRLSNNQIFGVIFISADQNPLLHDQTNREGLDENQALQDLRDLMLEVLNRLEVARYTARPRPGSAGSKPGAGLFSGFNFAPLFEYIEQRLPGDEKAKQLVQATEASFEGHLQEIQSVLARYHRLATLGQLIDHVLHEGRQPIAAIVNEADLGLMELQKAQQNGSPLLSKMQNRFTTVRNQGDVLATAFRRMEPFGGRKRGRPTQLYLEDIISDAFKVFDADLDRLHVRKELPTTRTLVRLDQAEIEEVIINLLQNSTYWLQEVNEQKRQILVKVDRRGPDHVDILFADSGPGVRQEIRDKIFDPYFSTKPEGIGLGLCIAGEIVSDYYDGSLELLEAGPLKGANFLITLRKRV